MKIDIINTDDDIFIAWVINKRTELKDELLCIKNEVKKIDDYINKFFPNFSFRLVYSPEGEIKPNSTYKDIPKTDDWYYELVKLLDECMIKNYLYVNFKGVISSYFIAGHNFKESRLMPMRKDVDNLMKTLYKINNPDDFFEKLKQFIEQYCIGENVDRTSMLFTLVLAFIYLSLESKDKVLKGFMEETAVYIDTLNSFIVSYMKKEYIDKKTLNYIRNTRYYCEENNFNDLKTLKNLLTKYNSSLNPPKTDYVQGNVISFNDVTTQEYTDEEADILNFEKQMIDEYLNENVFRKFRYINRAYNPDIALDASELYKNMPCINKKEGFDLMMKKLKSNNVNHEINKLIIELNLLHKGISKTKRTS